jgi:DNA integrity scanning protein DisA with diadenylate cyclase activity
MRQERNTASGVRLITAALCIIILVLPGIVVAETLANNTTINESTTSAVPDITTLPETPPPVVTPEPETPAVEIIPPPHLVLGVPEIQNLTCIMYGTVAPGSENVTIVDLRWDWGDNTTLEFHEFPSLHLYSSPGNYTLSITALQSDGQNITKTSNISVKGAVIQETPQETYPETPTETPAPATPAGPAGPGIPASAPVLTLLEPVIDGMNVTLNGNLNPGTPGSTIKSVSIDWDDGSVTNYPDLPATHQYLDPGIFTISITGNQSDGLSATRRITLDLKTEVPGSPGPAPTGPPPDEPPVFLIIIVTAIIVVVIGTVVQRVLQRRRGLAPAHNNQKGYTPGVKPMPEHLPSQEELRTICSKTDVSPDVLDSVIQVAVEIAREGREGQQVGTSFVVGDTNNVLNHSKQFVLNPFYGHMEEERQITDVSIRGHIKEFAQLDGAFLITGSGVVEAAGRYITVDMSKVHLPGGLGSRHSSIAGITQVTRSVGVVVSQSGGMISVFRNGKIVYTIHS